jgi:hypothetical protein
MRQLNNDALKHLLDLVNHEENDLYLSLYIPTDDHSISHIKTSLKSKILETLKMDERTNMEDLHPIYQDIIDELGNHLINEEGIRGGIAAFAKFNIEKYKQSKKSENFIVYHLSQKPILECTLSDVFNLGQIASYLSANLKTLVVNIERSYINLFNYIERDLNSLAVLDNKTDYADENDYQTSSLGAGVFGNRESKDQRDDNKFDYYFLKELIDELHKDEYLKADYKLILIYHSTIFNEEINKLITTIQNLFQIPIKSFSKNLNLKEEIHKAVEEYLEEFNTEIIKVTITKANEERRISTGLIEITKAAREGRIECLLIKPNLKLKGYVLDGYPYWEKVGTGNYKETSNLVPWIILRAILSNSNVMILPDDHADDAVALLRF